MWAPGPRWFSPPQRPFSPCFRRGINGSQVLVHVCSGSVTSVVVVGDGISFWRNRQSERVTAAGDEEVVSEFARVVAACRDHLKSEIEDV